MEIDLNDDGALFPAAPTKRRGRPKGLPKTGGRQKAPEASTPDEWRAMIGARPVKYFLDMLACKRRPVGGPNGTKVFRYPSSSEQSGAARQLIGYVLPRLAHMEIDAAVSSVSLEVDGNLDPRELARRMVFFLQSASRPQQPVVAGVSRTQQPVTIDVETSPADNEHTAELPTASDRYESSANEPEKTSSHHPRHQNGRSETVPAHVNDAVESVGIGSLTVTRRGDKWGILDDQKKLLEVHADRERAVSIATNLAAKKSASAQFADPSEHGLGGRMPQVNRRRM